MRDPIILLYTVAKASSLNYMKWEPRPQQLMRGSHKHTGRWGHTAYDTLRDHPTQTISGPAHCSAFIAFSTLKDYRTGL